MKTAVYVALGLALFQSVVGFALPTHDTPESRDERIKSRDVSSDFNVSPYSRDAATVDIAKRKPTTGKIRPKKHCKKQPKVRRGSHGGGSHGGGSHGGGSNSGGSHGGGSNSGGSHGGGSTNGASNNGKGGSNNGASNNGKGGSNNGASNNGKGGSNSGGSNSGGSSGSEEACPTLPTKDQIKALWKANPAFDSAKLFFYASTPGPDVAQAFIDQNFPGYSTVYSAFANEDSHGTWTDFTELLPDFWQVALAAFAEEATGTVYALLPKGQGNAVTWPANSYWNAALSILKSLPAVKNIIRIDDDDKHERSYMKGSA